MSTGANGGGLGAALSRSVSGIGPSSTDESVLEACALAAWATVAGALDDLGLEARDRLARAGRRALLAAGPAKDEDARLARALATVGLGALETGRVAAVPGALANPMCAPDGRLVSALAGRLDGFACASLALHVARCDGCDARMRVLGLAREELAPPLRVAAETAPEVRPPSDGRRVARLESPRVEIVLFHDGDGRTLAVYAELDEPVELSGAGLEPLESLPGYWLGRVTGARATVEAEVRVGASHAKVQLRLS